MDLPKGLKHRRRKADGKTEIVGTNIRGDEYVARVCEHSHEPDDRDLKILDVGSPEKRDANAFIKFYRDERENAKKEWTESMDAEYTDAAEKVIHAGFHLHESKVGYSRRYARAFERIKW